MKSKNDRNPLIEFGNLKFWGSNYLLVVLSIIASFTLCFIAYAIGDAIATLAPVLGLKLFSWLKKKERLST